MWAFSRTATADPRSANHTKEKVATSSDQAKGAFRMKRNTTCVAVTLQTTERRILTAAFSTICTP
jgi:hypothetical protein